MYNKFITYIKNKNLFLSDDKVLIAVSGGKDSMTLVNLFKEAGYDFGIAHFNHKTREGESDLDQEFVKNYSRENDIAFYTTSFDIKAAMKKGEGSNFQDLARRKRYDWLEEVRKNNGYDYVATAHHMNDNIETFLYKASKGSGLKGLVGIRAKNKYVIRPMLSISREEVEAYIVDNNIPFVEDKSNLTDDYNRNFIRHNIIPQFEKLHKNFNKRISITIDNLNDTSGQFDFLLDNYTKGFIEQKNNLIFINQDVLNEVPDSANFLYSILAKYGFNKSQALDIFSSIGSVGAMFASDKYELLVDRGVFILRSNEAIEYVDFNIDLGINYLENYGELNLELIENKDLNFTKGVYFLDYSKLNFPLKLRNWKFGDKYNPFGLGGKTKKIKDYFVDKKISRFEKTSVLLLLNDEEICLILDDNITYNYRIENDTTKVLKIRFNSLI